MPSFPSIACRCIPQAWSQLERGSVQRRSNARKCPCTHQPTQILCLVRHDPGVRQVDVSPRAVVLHRTYSDEFDQKSSWWTVGSDSMPLERHVLWQRRHGHRWRVLADWNRWQTRASFLALQVLTGRRRSIVCDVPLQRGVRKPTMCDEVLVRAQAWGIRRRP